jgi:putative PEP-CTERM system histidine kinase
VQGLILFWSHALAAAMFVGLLIWRLGAGARDPGQRLLLAGFAVTACWAWLSAIAPREPLARYAETARNLVWVGLLYSLSVKGAERQHGVKLVYAAVGAVVGFQLVADTVFFLTGNLAAAETATLLRITTAAGALVLVHNLYGQASPSSRTNIRLAMLGLALSWTYDLNLYTLSYLDPHTASDFVPWRGLLIALTGPLFALGARSEEGWRIRLSRAATFQSLSLLAICGYFAVMAILATALRGSGRDLSQGLLVAVLAAMTVGAMVLLPSARARSWAKVKVAKHFFEHRYDYRGEWLRFTETVGRADADALPLGERIIKAFADILDVPGGTLLQADSSGALVTAASWNWPGRNPPTEEPEASRAFWAHIEAEGRILEFDAYRAKWGDARDLNAPIPDWLATDRRAWAGVPLIHHDRLVGLVLLTGPEFRRALDWEDFDLLRTAGRQAAAALAEAHGQEALSNAQRFEEFNRRFAFILHDIKNLVSQLSLVSRNAERHADNPEFRADMVATLKSSVGKMNDLLARLAPQAGARPHHTEAQPLRPILAAAVAAKRRDRDVQLLGDTSLWVVADATALEQAVGHLLQNALEACSDPQPVVIKVSERGSEVAIAVIDKGVGMDSDFVRNRLFQPFASTKPGGFGIGSFEARSIVIAMGGRLGVDSKPGEGSQFTIYLPAAEAAGVERRKIA